MRDRQHYHDLGLALAKGWGDLQELLATLRASGIRPMALGFNKGGSPKHPLYVRYDRPLVDFTEAY